MAWIVFRIYFFILLYGKLMITFTIFRGKIHPIMEVTHLWESLEGSKFNTYNHRIVPQ